MIPCKHIFAVLNHAFDTNWDVLPLSYRENVWFTLDKDCVSIPVSKDTNVLGNINEESDFMHANTDLIADEVISPSVANETVDRQDNATGSLSFDMHSQIHSNNKSATINNALLRKCSSLAKKVQSDLYLVNDNSVLEEAYDKLNDCYSL